MAFEYKITASTVKTLVSAIGLGVKARHAHVTAADLLFSEGVRVDTMKDKAWRAEFVNDVIRQSFKDDEWATWSKPTKSLSLIDRAAKALMKKDIDRRYNTVMAYVREAEYLDTLDDEGRSARQTTTFEARLRKVLEAIIKKVQSRESLYFDSTKFVVHLKAALEVLNKG
jgi:hypothetical protein